MWTASGWNRAGNREQGIGNYSGNWALTTYNWASSTFFEGDGMAQNDTLIDIEDLTKIFYTDEVETHALSGIHLTISRGEYVAMSGPSGCGKSTLLSIL